MVVDYLRLENADRIYLRLKYAEIAPIEGFCTTFESYDYLKVDKYNTNINRRRSSSPSEGYLPTFGGYPPPPLPPLPPRMRPSSTRDRNQTSKGRTEIFTARSMTFKGVSDLTDYQKLLIYPAAPAFALNTRKWRMYSTVPT